MTAAPMDPYGNELLLATARTVRALLTYLTGEEGSGPSRQEAKILLMGLDEALEPFQAWRWTQAIGERLIPTDAPEPNHMNLSKAGHTQDTKDVTP